MSVCPVLEDVAKAVKEIAQSLLLLVNAQNTTTEAAAVCNAVMAAKQGVRLLICRAVKQNPVWMDALQTWSKAQLAWSQHGSALLEATKSTSVASLVDLEKTGELLASAPCTRLAWLITPPHDLPFKKSGRSRSLRYLACWDFNCASDPGGETLDLPLAFVTPVTPDLGLRDLLRPCFPAPFPAATEPLSTDR